MKKVLLSATLNALDSFEVGKCSDCPIAKKEYQETSCFNKYSCPIGYKPMNCPMEVKECLKSN